VDIVSWTGRARPGAGALQCGEEWMSDVERGTYELTDAEVREILDVRKADLKGCKTDVFVHYAGRTKGTGLMWVKERTCAYTRWTGTVNRHLYLTWAVKTEKDGRC
jgi:hypothetical protein